MFCALKIIKIKSIIKIFTLLDFFFLRAPYVQICIKCMLIECGDRQPFFASKGVAACIMIDMIFFRL